MGELSRIEIEKFIYNNMDFIKMFQINSGNEVKVRTKEGTYFI